jgi:hypothetical protein
MKALQNNGCVFIDTEYRVTDRSPHLVATPELLMFGTPFGDRSETLTFIDGLPGIDFTKAYHGDTCGLNHRHRPVARVDHDRVLARHREWFSVQLVFQQETRSRDLVTTKNSGHQSVSLRPWEAEPSQREALMGHGRHRTAGRRAAPAIGGTRA